MSMRADHFAKVASGHLVMSRSWIIMHEVPRGQLRPTRWRAAQRRREGLASLTVGIMSDPVYTRVPERSSGDGVESPGLPLRWRLGSGGTKPVPALSLLAMRFGVLSSFALAAFASSAWRSGHDGIVPVPHSNLRRVLTQSSRSSKASTNLSVATSEILSLERR